MDHWIPALPYWYVKCWKSAPVFPSRTVNLLSHVVFESWLLAQVSYHKTVFNSVYWHFNLSVLYCSELRKGHHSKLFLQYHLEATCLLTPDLNGRSLCTRSILQCCVTPDIKSPAGLLCHLENATTCSAKRRLPWNKLLFFLGN